MDVVERERMQQMICWQVVPGVQERLTLGRQSGGIEDDAFLDWAVSGEVDVGGSRYGRTGRLVVPDV